MLVSGQDLVVSAPFPSSLSGKPAWRRQRGLFVLCYLECGSSQGWQAWNIGILSVELSYSEHGLSQRHNGDLSPLSLLYLYWIFPST